MTPFLLVETTQHPATFREYRFKKTVSFVCKCLMTAFLFFSVANMVRADTVDSTFNAHLETTTYDSKEVNKLIALADGKIIAIGIFNNYNGQPVSGLIRLNADATLD